MALENPRNYRILFVLLLLCAFIGIWQPRHAFRFSGRETPCCDGGIGAVA